MPTLHRNLGAQLLMIVLVLTGLGFGYSFAREVVQAQRLANQAELSRQENEVIAAENRKLTRDLQYYQSDAYAELRARTDLNMRRPDEQVILPVLTPEAASAAGDPPGALSIASLPLAAPAPAAGNNPVPTGRNWDRWIALFSGPAH
ncbi:MAG TPA: septum formation initiator family protein [Chloroflexia bacterium]|nr:septum formation initiator family protein [Chloroflexia bacterium]